MELSGEFPLKLLCETMGVNRSSFYYWKKRLGDPSPRTKNLIDSIQLFQEYHMEYPSHDYRWLNARIHLDKSLIMSDPFAHNCTGQLPSISMGGSVLIINQQINNKIKPRDYSLGLHN